MRLEAKDLHQQLGGQAILKGVSIEVREGEMLGQSGPHGAGQTTLLRLSAGILKPPKEKLLADGQPLANLSQSERGRKIAYLTQEGTAHWPISVERIVALGRLPHLGTWQKPGKEDDRVIQRVLDQTGLSGLTDRSFPTLSGGEKARVLLARALTVEPEVLLADEPVAALDPSHQLEMMDLLKMHCGQGGSVVVVLHDLRLAAHYCDRLQLLIDGKTLATGDPKSVLTPDNLEKAFGIRIREDKTSAVEAFAMTWELGSSQQPDSGT